MALLPPHVFANSSCGGLSESKRLANPDLLSAGIPQMGFEVNGALNKPKKTREMFWSGRRDLNSGPPAPKAGALPGCATPRLKCFMIIRHPDEISRTGRTGVFALTGRQGTEHAHGGGDEPEASVFSSRSGEPARKFDGCPNRPNSHVILIAGHAAGPAT
jgi:hypothetical protein